MRCVRKLYSVLWWFDQPFCLKKRSGLYQPFLLPVLYQRWGISLYKSIDKKHRRGGSSEYFQICCQKLKGEDTFGDSEPEEDDVIVDNNSSDGVKPRMGIGASLQSLIHPGEGPICTLSDHPIQVRKLPLTEVGIGMPLNS